MTSSYVFIRLANVQHSDKQDLKRNEECNEHGTAVSIRKGDNDVNRKRAKHDRVAEQLETDCRFDNPHRRVVDVIERRSAHAQGACREASQTNQLMIETCEFDLHQYKRGHERKRSTRTKDIAPECDAETWNAAHLKKIHGIKTKNIERHQPDDQTLRKNAERSAHLKQRFLRNQKHGDRRRVDNEEYIANEQIRRGLRRRRRESAGEHERGAAERRRETEQPRDAKAARNIEALQSEDD